MEQIVATDVSIEGATEDLSLEGATTEDLSLEGATTENLSLDNRLVIVENKLNGLRGVPCGSDDHATATICPQAPIWIKESNRELYEPKTVSIGPYHYKKPHLSAMQEEKWYSLRDFLSRNPSVEIDFYFEEMKLLEPAARKCYGKGVKLNSDEFVEMLLLDGSFILEFYSKADSEQLDISWDTRAIISDMFLLENQIPLFIVHKLFAIHGDCRENGNKCTCPLLQLICKYTPRTCNNRQLLPLPNIQRNFCHFLDLLCMANLPDHARRVTNLIRGNASSYSIPSACELFSAGLRFERRLDARDISGVTFNGYILKMPLLVLTKGTKIMLVNIIAFEQSQLASSDRVFTGYAVLLCSLIKTDEDVALLEQCGVLQNMLPSNNEAVSFFNDLGACIFLEHANHYYSDLLTELKRYSELPWTRYRARLIQDYFRDPWTIYNLYYGFIALLLTILQTYVAFKQK